MQVKIYGNDKCHVFNNILESLIMIKDNLFMLNEIFQSVNSFLASGDFCRLQTVWIHIRRMR